MALARALVSGWRTGVARIAASRAGQVGGPRGFACTPTEESEEEPLFPAPAPRRHTINNTNKIFVGNLAWTVDSDELYDIFLPLGAIANAWVATDKDSGRSRGFGFVTFVDAKSYETALVEMGGFELQGRPMRLERAGGGQQ
mmetsp:Transcript_4371/g.15312  ORF Transcript_4371/g.15312 Transcript_4371/m.15312 type:complete len:142 (+) Transcript_4371:51-476(+)